MNTLPENKKLSVDELRKEFPKCYEFIDEVVKTFGRDGIKRVVWIKEGDKELGKPLVSDPERTVKVSEMCLDSSYFSDATERSKHHGKK